MLDSTKINFSQKKLSGKQHTWNSKKWYEEDDGIVLFLTIPCMLFSRKFFL
jgi:hypothetical protein